MNSFGRIGTKRSRPVLGSIILRNNRVLLRFAFVTLSDSRTKQTSVEGVWAVGDVVAHSASDNVCNG